MDRPVIAGIGISHPDRVLFPAAGTTKLDLARYYDTIAEWIVPHVADRPLTLVRCPTGVRPARRTVGGTPCRALKARMKFSTSRCRSVSSRMPPP